MPRLNSNQITALTQASIAEIACKFHHEIGTSPNHTERDHEYGCAVQSRLTYHISVLPLLSVILSRTARDRNSFL